MTDKITTVLWDVDGTLLDFIAAEKAAIRKLFREYDLGECTDEMLARYSKINRSYWVKLENGEMTKPEILTGRFRDFFVSEGLDPSIAAGKWPPYQRSHHPCQKLLPAFFILLLCLIFANGSPVCSVLDLEFPVIPAGDASLPHHGTLRCFLQN